MAAAGVADSEARGPAEALAFAEAALAALRVLGAETGLPVEGHAGLATGPAVAGVIGEARPQFDTWGPMVNRAARLQAASPPGAVPMDAGTAAVVDRPDAVHPGPSQFRGIGAVDRWRLDVPG